MNRINPLYYILLSVVIASFIIYKNSALKEELKQVEDSYKNSKELATELKEIKRVYSKNAQQMIVRILNTPKLKNKFEVTKKPTSIIISAKNLELSSAEYFLSKVLNANYNISFMAVNKNKNSLDLKMEIKW